MKIIDYIVVNDGDIKQLESKIRKCIKNGFQPFGTFTAIRSDGAFYFYQPVVKYENSN